MREVAAHLGMDYEQMMRDAEAGAEALFAAKAPMQSNALNLRDDKDGQ
jgi:hypothetical protein